MISFKIYFVAFLYFLIPTIAFGTLSVDLQVDEQSGINRLEEPVTAGIPIAENANITDVTQLAIKNGISTIPSQFRVLERWNTAANNTSGKIKWVLADFQATVSADSTSSYLLVDDNSASTAPPLTVHETSSDITINTGVAEFVVSKTSFNFLSSASHEGIPVISNNNSNGIVEIDGGDTFTSTNYEPDLVEIEEQGDMRVAIHVEGYHQNNSGNNGLRYVVRMHFYAGKPYCKIIHYYIHDQNLISTAMNNPSGVRTVDKTITTLKDSFQLSSPGTLTYSIGNISGQSTRTGGVTGAIGCQQTTYTSFSLPSSGNGTGQLPGWINLYDSSKGLAIIARNFSNKWPHALSVNDNGEVAYEILPSTLAPHDFYVYQAFREEYLIYLHGSSRDENEIQALSSGLANDYLFPHATNSYMCITKALGELSTYPSAIYTSFDNALDEALDNSISTSASHGYTGRWDWGGVYDDALTGNASSYYDGIGVAARQFVRSGDLKWLDFSRNYAENYTSVDQYYCGDGTKDRARWNGMGSGYMGSHHRNGNYIFASWLEGTLFLYRLTGDEWFWDRGVDTANMYWNRGMTPNYIAWGILAREGAQALMTIMRVWEINRDADLYTWMTSHMNYLIEDQQPNGTFQNYGRDNRHWQAMMNMGPGLYRLYLHTENENYKSALLAYADAMQPNAQGGCMVYGAGNDYDYVEKECTQSWDPDNSSATGPRISSVNAYAYQLTGDEKYKQEAHRQLSGNFEKYYTNGLGKSANTYHWCMVMEGILSGTPSLPASQRPIITNIDLSP